MEHPSGMFHGKLGTEYVCVGSVPMWASVCVGSHLVHFDQPLHLARKWGERDGEHARAAVVNAGADMRPKLERTLRAYTTPPSPKRMRCAHFSSLLCRIQVHRSQMRRSIILLCWILACGPLVVVCPNLCPRVVRVARPLDFLELANDMLHNVIFLRTR